MSSMAHKPGVYRDFTGRINYYGSICAVKNATFELLDGFKRFKGEEIIRIEFKKGVVISGGLVEADIESCEFRGRKLDRSVFRDGVFAGKEFSKSYWLGGEWMGEKWSDSYDKFGRQRLYAPPFWNEFDEVDGIITQWGRYKNFTGRVKYRFSDFYIENGELEIGRHHNRGMIIDGGTITEGNLSICEKIKC